MENIDKRIRETLQKSCDEIFASPKLKQKIDESISLKEEKSMKTISMKKVVIGVAAASLLLSGAVFAGHTAYMAAGVPSMPEYETYAQIGEAEARLGYTADHVETFRNGYAFAGASIGTDYAYDENGRRLYSYEEMDIEYKKTGEPSLSLVVEKPIENQYNDIVPEAVRTCDGITIEYWKEEFSIVDTDYVVTKKELEEMKAADADISIEWNENTAKTSHHVMWEKDGIRYMLFGFDVTLSPDGMMDMAEEIIMAD